MKKKVLFICVHNSGRSQMAEAFLKGMRGDRFEVASAGLDPRPLNPLVIQVMQEVGMDISKNKSQSVFELFKRGNRYDFVITVCKENIEAKCPIFPGFMVKRISWDFDDPAMVQGNPEEQLAKIRKIRDAVEQTVKTWIDSVQID